MRVGDTVYLDHNATTPVDPAVLAAVERCLTRSWANPSSAHPLGWEAREEVDEARQRVADLLGCETDEVFFTSGGTEATNLALFGVAVLCPSPGTIVTSTVEHPATQAPCARLEDMGWKIIRIPVDARCVVDAKSAAEAIGKGAALVTLMHSNNEVGAIQPVEEIAKAAHRSKAIVHVDAAQSVGKVKVDFNDLGADLMTVAGHKLYAPKGIGALIVRRGLKIPPFVLGAGQERGLRPGTENVAGIAGLGAAATLAKEGLENELKRQERLRDHLEDTILSSIPGTEINAGDASRLPNTSSISFPGVRATTLLARCDRLAASTGAACHDDHEEPSPVLMAMGASEEAALGAVRLSLGRKTTEEDVELACRELAQVWKSLAGG